MKKKKEKKNRKEGGEVCVSRTTEQSSRAERGEEGLEVGMPGGQTGSQSAREKSEKKGVRQKANTDRDGCRRTAPLIRRQSCRYIKHKPAKQTKSKQRKASQGHTNIRRQTEKQAEQQTDTRRD